MKIFNKVEERRIITSEILELTEGMVDDLRNWADLPYVGDNDDDLVKYIADLKGEDEELFTAPGAPAWLDDFYQSLLGYRVQIFQLESTRDSDPDSLLVLTDDNDNELATTVSSM